MPITDYFLAPDDTSAAAVIDERGPVPAGLPTVESKGLDPAVNLGFLEAFLTGHTYEEVTALPRQGAAVSDTSQLPVIVAVTDTLRDALATATDEQIPTVAARWAETEELAGTDPAGLADFIRRLADLARKADNQHLYCYWTI